MSKSFKSLLAVLSCTVLLTTGTIDASSSSSSASSPPHILFIVADDLGYNDISLHGSPQIPTPNIDSLAQDGVTLGRFYANPVCSPTRTSLLSGRSTCHTGIYMPFLDGTPYQLSANFTLLPQYLKSCCNYSTHIVGKWHLGFSNYANLPLSRGFDSHLGYWNGAEDYVQHYVAGAYDFNANLRIATEYNNTFSTHVFADEAVNIINSFGPNGNHSTQPMFLYLAFQSVHWPLEAPQNYLDRFKNTTGNSTERQAVCAMAAFLDDAIGNVTAALKQNNMWDNTLIIFQSDNGGPTHLDEGTSSNNYPLRGGKNTIWEGGTRVDAIIRGAGIQKTNYINTEYVHVTDWLPTLVSMASGTNWTNFIPPNEPPYQYGDGMDVWSTLSTGAPSPRDWVLLETHPTGATDRVHGDGLIYQDWKLIKWNNTMPQVENGWFPPPGQDPSKVDYLVKCNGIQPSKVDPTECNKDWCLFNITADPCEYNNVASDHPNIVKQLINMLEPFQATAVPPVAPSECKPIQVPIPNDPGNVAWQPGCP